MTGSAYADHTDERLDKLFLELRQTDNFFVIQGLQAKISRILRESRSPSIDLLMQRAGESARVQEDERALVHYSDVVAFAPDYAAGWFARAEHLWRMERLADAVVDLARAVKLEPRHYQAWLLLGEIFMEIDNVPGAYRALNEALAVNPHLGDARQTVEYLRPQVEGRGI